MRPTVNIEKRMWKTDFSLKVSLNTQSFEKLSELINGKKIHNCTEYRTTTKKTFTRICDSPGILWGQLSVLVHEPYKRKKKSIKLSLKGDMFLPRTESVHVPTTIRKHNLAHN